jgi:hypothetical protein
MGLLHRTSIVVSLWERPKVAHALGSVAIAAALSAVTPFLALFGSIVWIPFADMLVGSDLVILLEFRVASYASQISMALSATTTDAQGETVEG